MKTCSRFLCPLVFAGSMMATLASGSPASDEGESPEAQVSSGLALPHWDEGECRENFDIRIWPRSVVVWLEDENLRSLIADPSTPEAERQSLKRILALQRAWRTHS